MDAKDKLKKVVERRILERFLRWILEFECCRPKMHAIFDFLEEKILGIVWPTEYESGGWEGQEFPSTENGLKQKKNHVNNDD